MLFFDKHFLCRSRQHWLQHLKLHNNLSIRLTNTVHNSLKFLWVIPALVMEISQKQMPWKAIPERLPGHLFWVFFSKARNEIAVDQKYLVITTFLVLGNQRLSATPKVINSQVLIASYSTNSLSKASIKFKSICALELEGFCFLLTSPRAASIFAK